MKKKTSVFVIVDIIVLILIAIFLGLSIASTAYKWNNAATASFFFLYIICLFFSIVKPFFSKERLQLLDWLIVGYNFLTILVLIVASTFILKDALSGTPTEVLCVLGGGLFTLYGVALTIKFNIWNEQDKERMKALPHVFVVSDQTWKNTDDSLIKRKDITDVYTSLKKVDKKTSHFAINDLRLYNSDASTCFIKGLFINKEYFLLFKYDEVLIKDSYNDFILNFCFEINEIKNVTIVLGDTLDNTYLCEASYELPKNNRKKETAIVLRGILKPERRNDIDCDEIVLKHYERIYSSIENKE